MFLCVPIEQIIIAFFRIMPALPCGATDHRLMDIQATGDGDRGQAQFAMCDMTNQPECHNALGRFIATLNGSDWQARKLGYLRGHLIEISALRPARKEFRKM